MQDADQLRKRKTQGVSDHLLSDTGLDRVEVSLPTTRQRGRLFLFNRTSSSTVRQRRSTIVLRSSSVWRIRWSRQPTSDHIRIDAKRRVLDARIRRSREARKPGANLNGAKA